MRDQDSLHRFLIEGSNIRGELVHLDESWKALLAKNAYPEPVRALLGEALAAVALLGATLKIDGSIILQVRGEGPVTLLVAQAQSDHTVRGLARHNDAVPSDRPLTELFGTSRLVITIDAGQGGEPYQGIVPLAGERLAEALQGYFDQSEQLPTKLWLTSSERSAAGLLLQDLPGEQLDPDAWDRTTLLADTLTEQELLDLPAPTLLRRLYNQEWVRLFESQPVSFRCSCSAERCRGMLLALGEPEVRTILDEQGEVSINCEFCNSRYRFDAVDIEQLFRDGATPSVPPTRH